MALRPMPTRQDARPGTGDERFARAYDSATGGWTAPVGASPDSCRGCGNWTSNCTCGG